MEKVRLGKSELWVSKLCFGSLTVSPLQANYSVDQAGDLIAFALQKGINFIDTADLYQNYEQIRNGIKKAKISPVLCTKSYDYEWDGAKDNLEKARRMLDRDVIDLFMLHEQESIHTLRGHKPALDYLLEAKQKGLIKAIGISTHFVSGVYGALSFKEIDVIHPILNFRGLGIVDGTIEEMETALKEAKHEDLGIFAMKPLGGGNLIGLRDRAFSYIKGKPMIDSIAIGMQSEEEILYNIRRINGQSVSEELKRATKNKKRSLHIDEWCVKCGKCVETCPQEALTIGPEKAVVDPDKCVLCAYCSAACPEFCIKVV
ncbi:MAG TPA: aldo/keto reductase [Eubacteriaceae bacterium]|nr:aldo/keto reductase [Eubacteriaceae bacterium]